MKTATTKTTAKNASHFARGSGVYKCRCCERQTRSTGRGDNENVGLCAECYDLAGEENSLSDNGEFYSGPNSVLELIRAVGLRGGKASYWRDLENKARKELGMEPIEAPAEPKAPTEVIVALHTPNGDVRTAYPMTKKVDALIMVSSYIAESKSFTITYE